MTAAAAKSLQSCPTLCDPIDGSPPGSPVPGILQARTLEWVAISFSNAWKWKVKMKSLSRVRLSATPWTAAFQALLSMGFSRQEYWSLILNGYFIYNCLTYTFLPICLIPQISCCSVAQPCPTLSDPVDRSLPGSSIHGIFQVRVLEWGATAFSMLYD